MSFGICIIGCGDMGRAHAKAWDAHDGVTIVSVFDPVPEAREALANEYGATACDDPGEAMADRGVDAVSICTPANHHRAVACRAAELGRHVLCEKPLATTADDCDAMVEAAERGDVRLCVGHQYRDWSRNRRVREAIAAGEFGSPLMARYTVVIEVRKKLAMHRRSQNMGPVMDMAGHYTDLMRCFTGSEPTEVFASGAVFGRDHPRLAEVPRDDLAIDAAHLQVRFTGGHVLTQELIWGMPDGFPGFGEESVIGPKASFRGNHDGATLTFGPNHVEPLDGGRTGPEPRVADLLDAVRTGKGPAVSGHDGRVAALVSIAALESIETGRAVEVPATATA